MIRKSFVFLDGVDKCVEQKLWDIGITDWWAFLRAKEIEGLSKARKLHYDREIARAKKALFNFDSGYFVDLLPRSESWRLYDFFKEDAVFLDIETTGLSDRALLTMVGLFDGVDTKVMIKDINFDPAALREELRKYKLIVTYNGGSFDLPFIEKRFPGLLPRVPHFDLRTACNKVGLRGGLKEVEKKLGIERRKLVGDIDGGDALRLWKMYKASGDDYYLNLLVEYNEEDVINLKTIADEVVGRLKRGHKS